MQRVDPFRGDRLAAHQATKGKSGEDGDLVGGVTAFNISGRIGFGVAQGLGVSQDIAVASTLFRHAGEDVVGGPVDDAADPFNAVAAKRLFERFKDGNAAANSGFHQHVNPPFCSRCSNLSPMASNHSFVGGHHWFAGFDSRQDQAAGWLQTAHDFNHQVHVGIGNHCGRIGRQQVFAEWDGPRSIEIAHGHLTQLQISDQWMPPLW